MADLSGKAANSDYRSIISESPWLDSGYTNNTKDYVIDIEKICSLFICDSNGLPVSSVTSINSADIKILTGNELLSNKIFPSGSTNPVFPYFNFFVQAINIAHQETVMPVKNLTEGFTTYLFGEEPPIYQISGTLVNTTFDNWSDMFIVLYKEILRASKLALLSIIKQMPLQICLQFQSTSLIGDIISLNVGKRAELEQGDSFTFNFLVKKYQNAYMELTSTAENTAPVTFSNILVASNNLAVTNSIDKQKKKKSSSKEITQANNLYSYDADIKSTADDEVI